MSNQQDRKNNQEIVPIHSPAWGEEEEGAVLLAMREGYLSEGRYVRAFEREFADYVGAKYAVLVPSGAVALYMALYVERGGFASRIGVSDYYGIFAANAAIQAGYKMVQPVDDMADFLRTSPTDANFHSYCSVHANGRVTTHKPLKDANRWLALGDVEDCCQAIDYHTKDMVSCYSFHPSKLMTCGGIGGAVACDQEDVYMSLMAIKDHGRPERAMGMSVSDIHSRWGSNFKVADMNAAFGLEQLKKLPQRLARLREVYSLYREILGDRVGWIEGGAPSWRVDCLVDNPDAVIEALADSGFEAKRFYFPLHAQPRYASQDTKFPKTNELYNRGLYLPSSFEITDEQVKRICKIMIKTSFK